MPLGKALTDKFHGTLPKTECNIQDIRPYKENEKINLMISIKNILVGEYLVQHCTYYKFEIFKSEHVNKITAIINNYFDKFTSKYF